MSDCISRGREQLEQLYQESLALIEALRQQVAGQQGIDPGAAGTDSSPAGVDPEVAGSTGERQSQ